MPTWPLCLHCLAVCDTAWRMLRCFQSYFVVKIKMITGRGVGGWGYVVKQCVTRSSSGIYVLSGCMFIWTFSLFRNIELSFSAVLNREWHTMMKKKKKCTVLCVCVLFFFVCCFFVFHGLGWKRFWVSFAQRICCVESSLSCASEALKKIIFLFYLSRSLVVVLGFL